jgi:hypothetical protein
LRLHEYHARSVEATLSRADEAIHRMERLLTKGGQEGVVSKIEDTLSPELREVLLSQLRTLQVMLARMANSFSLDPHPLDIRRVLDAEISTLWVLFEDCRPARMKGYGQEFAPEARAALEETVEGLVAHVLTMRARLDGA